MNDISMFFIGGISAITSRTLTAPMELMKIQQQNKFFAQTSIKQTFHKEGIKSFWKGNGVNCLRIFPQNAISYGTYEYTKKHINPFLSGMISGTLAISLIYPAENLRSRFSLQLKNEIIYPSLLSAFKNIPIRQLYQGLSMSLFGYTSFTAFNYAFYEEYKKYTNSFIAGGLAGSSAVSITYPTDIIRRRIQLQGFHHSVPKYSSIIDTIHKMYQREGQLRAFYQGLTITIIKLFPTMAVHFYCIEILKKYYIDNI
jgi:solute carrier family 25 (mitochondrial phosphate transporter), member 23/24/25/41